MIAHPLEAIGVRRIFRLSGLTGFSDRDIADYLNKKPVRYQGKDYILRPKRPAHQVKRFGPPVFQKDAVRDIAQRPFYVGVVPYYGVRESGQKRKRRDAVALYPGKHPALIPESLFEQTHEARQSRRALMPTPGVGSKGLVYPLSGLLLCACCHKPLRGSSNQQGRRYYRSSVRIEQKGECRQPTLHADEVEQAVLARLQETEEGAR